jgi:hypothetical protein
MPAVGRPQKRGSPLFHREIADLVLQAPSATVGLFLQAAVVWLQRRREILSGQDQPGAARYFKLWDIFADIAYLKGWWRCDVLSDGSHQSSADVACRPRVPAWRKSC